MNKKVMKLASRGKRFGAYCLDEIIPSILGCVLITVLVKLLLTTGVRSILFDYGYGYGYGYNPNGISAVGPVVSIFIVMVIAFAYLGVQIYFYSQSKTIGKAILGLQVISSVDGQPIGLLKMIIREWFAKKASGAAFLLGYIWILIDDKNRGWHDKIMDTYVVDLVETAKIGVEPQSEPVKENVPVQEERIESITEEPLINIEEDNKEHEVQDVDIINPEGGESIG